MCVRVSVCVCLSVFMVYMCDSVRLCDDKLF